MHKNILTQNTDKDTRQEPISNISNKLFSCSQNQCREPILISLTLKFPNKEKRGLNNGLTTILWVTFTDITLFFKSLLLSQCKKLKVAVEGPEKIFTFKYEQSYRRKS